MNVVKLQGQFRNEEDSSEFEFFDGEAFVKFNVIEVNLDRRQITVACTDRGKISIYTYVLMQEGDRIYFEHGPLYTQIEVDYET